jgi:hypothetical protein
MTPEQTELIEKLNCLEFEISQLNHAYQQWRRYVEQGTAPDWMAAAIKITYNALITFYMDTVSALALLQCEDAKTGAFKWRDPRSQCESIETAKIRKTSREANR